MAMPFTTPFSASQDEASPPLENQSFGQEPSVQKGLQDAPPSKKTQTLWEKVKHSFDYGNSGKQG